MAKRKVTRSRPSVTVAFRKPPRGIVRGARRITRFARGNGGAAMAIGWAKMQENMKTVKPLFDGIPGALKKEMIREV